MTSAKLNALCPPDCSSLFPEWLSRTNTLSRKPSLSRHINVMAFDEMMETLVAKHDQLNLKNRNRRSGVALTAEVAPTTEANAANAPNPKI